MTGKTLARTYDRLTRDERVRLLFAARGRQDEAEADNLTRSAPSIPVRMKDFAPCLMAFKTLALLVFVELLDVAADCEAAWLAAESAVEDDAGAARWGRVATGHGYRLRTKWLGWVRFCEEWHASPRLLWEHLPGLDRIDRALATAEIEACSDYEFVAAVNAIRPAGRPPVIRNPVTVDAAVAELRQVFDKLVLDLSP